MLCLPPRTSPRYLLIGPVWYFQECLCVGAVYQKRWYQGSWLRGLCSLSPHTIMFVVVSLSFFRHSLLDFFLDKLFLMLHISSRLHVIWPSETPELRPRRGESIPLHDSNVACLDVIKHQYFTVLNDDEHTLNVANYDLGKFVLWFLINSYSSCSSCGRSEGRLRTLAVINCNINKLWQ